MATLTKSLPAGQWLDARKMSGTKQQEMDYTYTNMDKLIRMSLGENANFSNAKYDGDYSISLEEAQERKFRFIKEQLRIDEGSKVLDLGCGWGGFLKYLKSIKANGIGVNLSAGQLAVCKKSGFNAHFKDMRYVKPEDFGLFDAVNSTGSFEHVASIEDHLEGRQDKVFGDFFQGVANLLPSGGRMFLQTMAFGPNMIPYEEFDINAPKDSDPYILALLTKHFLDSWLPYGDKQIIDTAAPYFKLIHSESGRLDFVETQNQWWKRIHKFSLKKYMWMLSFAPKYIMDKEFRHQLAFMRIQPLTRCFEREIFEHYRIVLEKI